MRAVRWAEGVKPLLVPIERVQQHPDNPNNGDIEALIESIQVSGFVTAITADLSTGYIVAGNHRYQALHALGATQIPVIWVDHFDAENKGAVRFMVGDNAVGQLAVMDKSMVAAHLHTLLETQAGLAGSGVTAESYQRLLQDMLADQTPIPTADGFGHGTAPSGIFQVVVDFDNTEDRDALFAEIAERYENTRMVNL
jgi:hypothetical protein